MTFAGSSVFRGSVVADIADAGSGSGALSEDLAVEVGDDDRVAGLVAVADDEDLSERVGDIDLVEDFVEVDDSGGGHRSQVCPGG